MYTYIYIYIFIYIIYSFVHFIYSPNSECSWGSGAFYSPGETCPAEIGCGLLAPVGPQFFFMFLVQSPKIAEIGCGRWPPLAPNFLF